MPQYREIVVVHKLLTAMAEHGISEDDMAKRIGLAPPVLADKLRGKSHLSLDELFSLADVLHFDAVDLVRTPDQG